MQSIINAWLLLFWLTWILFFLNTNNLIKLFISSEIIWIVMYIFSLIVGITNDDLTLYTLSLLIIAMASIEFSIGFVLIILLKKLFKDVNILDNFGTDWSTISKLNKI